MDVKTKKSIRIIIMEKDNGAHSFTEGAIYENPTKENSYLDLSYLNKIERENALDLVLSKDKIIERDIFEDYEYLHLHKKDGWRVDRRIDTLGKERITYPQFLEMMGGKKSTEIETFTLENLISFGKQCFYSGFEKSEKDDANCFTAWREEASGLLTEFKSNQ